MNLKFSVINKSGSKLQSDNKPFPSLAKWTVSPDVDIQSGSQFSSGINSFGTGDVAALGYINSVTVSVKLLSSGELEPTITGSETSSYEISGSQVTFTITQ